MLVTLVLSMTLMAAFLYGAWDGLRHGFTFWQYAGRFLAMLYLMKAFDIIFLDWFLFTKSRFYQHSYQETKGCAGYHQFGFNRREQLVGRRRGNAIPPDCIFGAGCDVAPLCTENL